MSTFLLRERLGMSEPQREDRTRKEKNEAVNADRVLHFRFESQQLMMVALWGLV
jgi:hypothetical protein